MNRRYIQSSGPVPALVGGAALERERERRGEARQMGKRGEEENTAFSLSICLSVRLSACQSMVLFDVRFG